MRDRGPLATGQGGRTLGGHTPGYCYYGSWIRTLDGHDGEEVIMSRRKVHSDKKV